jgi:hypothetical protein
VSPEHIVGAEGVNTGGSILSTIVKVNWHPVTAVPTQLRTVPLTTLFIVIEFIVVVEVFPPHVHTYEEKPGGAVITSVSPLHT